MKFGGGGSVLQHPSAFFCLLATSPTCWKLENLQTIRKYIRKTIQYRILLRWSRVNFWKWLNNCVVVHLLFCHLACILMKYLLGAIYSCQLSCGLHARTWGKEDPHVYGHLEHGSGLRSTLQFSLARMLSQLQSSICDCWCFSPTFWVSLEYFCLLIASSFFESPTMKAKYIPLS